MGHETSAPDADSRERDPRVQGWGAWSRSSAKVRTAGTVGRPSAHRLGELEDVGGPLSPSGPGWTSHGGAFSS